MEEESFDFVNSLVVEAISSQFWPNLAFSVKNLKFRTHIRDGVSFHYRSRATLVTPHNNPKGDETIPQNSRNIALGT